MYVDKQALKLSKVDLQDNLPCIAADNRILNTDNMMHCMIHVVRTPSIFSHWC